MQIISSKLAAELSRCGANIYGVQADPACQPFLPPLEGVGKQRHYTPRQYLALLIQTRVMRLGLSIPAAGRLTTRILEEVAINPAAGAVVIECHENGFNAFYAVGRNDLSFPRRDAALAAGPSMLRVTLDMAGLWRAVDAVFTVHGRAVEADADAA